MITSSILTGTIVDITIGGTVTSGIVMRRRLERELLIENILE